MKTKEEVQKVPEALRGIALLKATRDLLAEPAKMAEKTGLPGARYDQSNPGDLYLDCDTPACVLGWMAVLAGAVTFRRRHWGHDYSSEGIGKLAGLGFYEASDLYTGRWQRWGVKDPPSGDILRRRASTAVRVLDRIIEEQEQKQFILA